MTDKEYLAFINQNYENQERYVLELKKIYKEYINEASRLTFDLDYNPEETFSFAKFPKTKKLMDKLIVRFSKDVQLLIENGIYKSWNLANTKNDKLVLDIFKGRLSANQIPNYNLRNIDALREFQKRKTSGLNLSNRVYNIGKQFNKDVELFLDKSLVSGISAKDLAKEMNNSLLKPKTTGGRGVYKSSYANSLRLTRTELNMAYRGSDNERFNQFDFVVGQEIKRSNRFFKCDICEPLVGKYNKQFVFKGFHPNCRCYVVPILCTKEELDKLTENIIQGKSNLGFKSENAVNELPSNFNDWIDKNKSKILSAKNIPYFIQDNINLKELKFAK